MTKKDNKQRIKNEAINKITQIYHPEYKFPYSDYSEDGSYPEQREYEIRKIIEEMNAELKKI